MTTTKTTDETGMGLGAAAALVMGSIIGTGVFLLPASLASFGSISLVAFVFTAIGAIALAQMFGVLSKRMPADGGPYAYARTAFGNALVILTAIVFVIGLVLHLHMRRRFT